MGTGDVFPSEVFAVVGVAEVAGVQDVYIALVDDLGGGVRYFVVGVAEEVEPVFGLVEDLGEEDEGWTVRSGGFDVDASKLDVFGVD